MRGSNKDPGYEVGVEMEKWACRGLNSRFGHITGGHICVLGSMTSILPAGSRAISDIFYGM